jgi:hypothetical protein
MVAIEVPVTNRADLQPRCGHWPPGHGAWGVFERTRDKGQAMMRALLEGPSLRVYIQNQSDCGNGGSRASVGVLKKSRREATQFKRMLMQEPISLKAILRGTGCLHFTDLRRCFQSHQV